MVYRVGWLGAALLQALVGLVLLPLVSWAADPVGKVSISGQFGIATYRMSDVNAAMARSDQIVHADGQAPADWETPDKLHHGFDFMSEANYDLTRDIRLGLNYGKTSGTTKKDFLQILTVKSQTTTIVPRLLYRIPWRPLIDMSLRAFGGPVFLRSTKTTVSHEDTDKSKPRLETLTINGSGTGFTGGIVGEYTVSDRFTLGFEGGYRFAKAKHKSSSYTITKIPNGGFPNPDSGLNEDRTLRDDSYLWGFMEGRPAKGDEPQIIPIEADFSGLDIRVALHVYIF